VQSGRRRSLLLFAAALAVRLVYVAQLRGAPYFDVPLVDGASYFRIADAVASGDLLGGREVFWQPPLYPYVLALLLTIVGPSMTRIYAAQAVIGALSCLLVYLLGRRLFHERAAWCAGLIMVLYGPLIHFDAQPLIPVLHIALVLAGLLLIARGAGIPRPDRHATRSMGLAGILWGLAAAATPNILLAVPVVAVWALRRLRAATVAMLVLGVVAPIAVVAGRNLAVSGEPVLISSNGGINFYIGNNPDYERTIRIRPGGEFERLAQEPENLGIVGQGARSRYFAARAVRFIIDYPNQALRLYLRKALDLIAGREIPRNQDQYEYRAYSSLLAILLWRHGIAFPFGVVAPLALAGMLVRSGPATPGPAGSGRALLLSYAGAYALSILLFFPTDRYRLPLVPVLALFAGNLLGSMREIWKRSTIAAALMSGLVLFNLDAFKPGEAYPEEETLNRAYALKMKGRRDEAREQYRAAIALNPNRIDPHNSLAVMSAEDGRWEEAVDHYRDLLQIAPDFVDVRRGLGQAYLALGRREEARREWQIAVRLAPGAGLALADLCLSYFDEGIPEIAEPYCVRAAASRPDLPETRYALGVVARALGKRDLARRELSEAARLFPLGSPGRARAEDLLEKMRRRDRKLAGEREKGKP
jgi:tetratricopeptide (TPR) repeat protein